MNKVSTNIKALRKERNLTQDQLAEKLNVTRQAVSNWENGKTQPDVDTLVKLAQVLEISVENLIYGDQTKTLLRRSGGETEGMEIARNIKRLANVLAVLGCIALFALGVISGPAGVLLFLPLGGLVIWIVWMLLNGFAQILENSEKCVAILSGENEEPAQEPTEKSAVKEQNPWTCHSCGTVNEGRVEYCIQCGVTKQWSEAQKEK